MSFKADDGRVAGIRAGVVPDAPGREGHLLSVERSSPSWVLS